MNHEQVIDEVVAARGGDEGAYGRLVRAFLPAAVYFGVRFAARRLDASDVEHIAYGVILDATATFDWAAHPGTTFRAHIYWQMRNAVRNAVRRERSQRAAGGDVYSFESVAWLPPDDDTEAPQILRETIDEWDSMGGRWARDAKLLRLRFGIGCEEHTFGAIAEAMSCCRYTVYKLFPTACRRLRESLTEKSPGHFSAAV